MNDKHTKQEIIITKKAFGPKFDLDSMMLVYDMLHKSSHTGLFNKSDILRNGRRCWGADACAVRNERRFRTERIHWWQLAQRQCRGCRHANHLLLACPVSKTLSSGRGLERQSEGKATRGEVEVGGGRRKGSEKILKMKLWNTGSQPHPQKSEQKYRYVCACRCSCRE
jgi:hypothetical protein